VRRAAYELTAEHEATHWWFVSRRELVLQQVRRAAAELGHPARRLRLLDYGCGTGFNLPHLAAFGEAVGAEQDREGLAGFGKARGHLVLDLAENVSEHEGRFDLVTALDVLEHIEDDVEGLDRMRRFLAPGGQLLLTVPAYDWLWSGEDVLSEHRRRYTAHRLVSASTTAGFEVAYLSYFNLTILPAMAAVVWARRLFAGQGLPRSNLTRAPALVTRVLRLVTQREAHLIGTQRIRLPAGTSLICRLRLARPATVRVPQPRRYITFGAPYIGEAERREVVACLESGWIGSGPRVERFEQAFRSELGDAPAVVAVSSGTAALQLALLQLDLEPGAEVITTPMTFCATASAIVHAGAVPVFADCDPITMNIDPAQVRAKITSRTRAILPVHFAGRPCDMAALLELADVHGLRVVEDCAHAIESAIDGRRCGTFGEFGCFSFYVTKNVTTGEGGMVVCRSPEHADRIRVMALHGMTKDAWHRHHDDGFVHYDVVALGFKYNMTDLAASLGIHQLARLDAMWARRKRHWEFYLEALRDLPLTLPPGPPANMRHAFHLFTCLIDPGRTRVTRDELLQSLHRRGIGTGVHYTPVHLHTYYRRSYGYRPGDLPNAERIGAHTFSLPLSGALTEEDAARVAAALHEVLA
jgi:dTDP-4-amino-4,6-dideoxygalactose transaminase/SAM-dependent methyltransferase